MSYKIFNSEFDQTINGYIYSSRDLSKSPHFKEVVPGKWANTNKPNELAQTAIATCETKDDAEKYIELRIEADALAGLTSARAGVFTPVLVKKTA